MACMDSLLQAQSQCISGTTGHYVAFQHHYQQRPSNSQHFDSDQQAQHTAVGQLKWLFSATVTMIVQHTRQVQARMLQVKTMQGRNSQHHYTVVGLWSALVPGCTSMYMQVWVCSTGNMQT